MPLLIAFLKVKPLEINLIEIVQTHHGEVYKILKDIKKT